MIFFQTFYERAALGEEMTERDLIDYGYKVVTIEHEDFTGMVTRYSNGAVELEDGSIMPASQYDSRIDVTEDAHVSQQSKSLETSSRHEAEPSFNISGVEIDERRM
jgi:hypothetical protein